MVLCCGPLILVNVLLNGLFPKLLLKLEIYLIFVFSRVINLICLITLVISFCECLMIRCEAFITRIFWKISCESYLGS